MSRITYAVNGRRQLMTSDEVQQLNKIIRRAHNLGYCFPNMPDFEIIAEQRAAELFNKIMEDEDNVLQALLPPTISHEHGTRR